jgi:hypothetical protein
MDNPHRVSSSQSQRPQFTVLSLLGLITFSALLIGVMAIGYQARKAKGKLQSEISDLQQANLELQRQLENSIGQGMRTQYAEKILFHLFANIEKHPDLKQRLADYEKRKIGISVHPMVEGDNLTYINVYSLEGNKASVPFCHSFLVEEEPFRVIANIKGEQGRTPRPREGTWYCSAGKDGKDRWFIIDKTGFTEFMPEESTE